MNEINYYLTKIGHWSAVALAFALPVSTAATHALLVIAVLSVILTGQWREKIAMIVNFRAITMLLVLFSLLLLGVFYSTASLEQALAQLGKYDKLLLGVLLIPLFVEQHWRDCALYAFLGAILLTILLAPIKAIVGLPFGHFDDLAVFKDHIQTGFAVAIAIYFIAILYTQAQKKHLKWFYLIFGLASVCYLFSIGGRTGYMVFFVLIILFLWEKWRIKGLLSAFLVLLLGISVIYFTSPIFKARMVEAHHDWVAYHQGNEVTSVGLRMSFAKNSWNLVKQHPIFGTGTGSFIPEYAKLPLPVNEITHNPHNEFLNITVQLGLVGLAIFLLAFYYQWRESLLLPITMRYLARGVVLTLFVGCFANSWLMDTTEGHFYVYFMALCFASGIRAVKNH